MCVVGCSPTTWLKPRAPQELKVEWSALELDASVPPTGSDHPDQSSPPPAGRPRDGPQSSVTRLNPLPPQSSYSTIK